MEIKGLLVWLQPEVKEWLQTHAQTDPRQVALQKSPFGERPSSKELAQQLFGYQKAKSKIPTYYSTPGIAYPPALSMEQCSSELTARWKSKLLKGKSLLDLTAGFGVDAFFLGENFAQLEVVEKQEHLARLAQHNLRLLRQSTFQVHNTTTEEFLDGDSNTFDWLYLDPARRDAAGGKVFRLSDCTPNIIELLPKLLQRGRNILLKTSPLLDIQQALNDLSGAQKVVILAVKNEVKELLFFLGEDRSNDPEILAIDLATEGESRFSFRKSEEADASASIGPIQAWLYEPNAAVMKAGAFRSVAQRYRLCKLHSNTHLYTSKEKIPDFPGKVYSVLADLAPHKKALRKVFKADQAMVGTRNYPGTPQQLREKLALKDGGTHYLMGYTNHLNQKRLAVVLRQ
ncbi:MAG TPA: SAM-dependent methyltransferase [Cytophagales bacterium]|nr:SAM-dependent methyltransferase [Cytophagales bacterium]HAA18496.1 SAM-dependent methyltransferase [Cytophagales bacterium]HAP58505.1 SAM-dependent methyltransferase [Cytophagales bacterium]